MGNAAGGEGIESKAHEDHSDFEGEGGNELPRFQGLAHGFKYFRTVSSTLVTPT